MLAVGAWMLGFQEPETALPRLFDERTNHQVYLATILPIRSARDADNLSRLVGMK